MSDRPNITTRHTRRGTWRLHLYDRVAYRTAAALAKAEGVGPDEAVPVSVPAGTRELWRLGDFGPAFPSMAAAAAAHRRDPDAGLFSVRVVG